MPPPFHAFGLAAVLALVATPARAMAAKKAADAPPTALVEIAPLGSLLGQVAARAEAGLWRDFSIAGAYEQRRAPSERAGFRDEHAAESFELVLYPLGLKDYPVFLAAGVRHEDATIGRQRLRDTNSWARTSAGELDDTWRNRDVYWSATQAIGVRLTRFGLLTASLRFARDELMSKTSATLRDDVRSYDPDLSSRGRPTVASSLLLHAGVYLP